MAHTQLITAGIRHCTTEDGVRIAYFIEGEGPPFVWIQGWVSHLEVDRALQAVLPQKDPYMRVQMDKRGTGMSA